MRYMLKGASAGFGELIDPWKAMISREGADFISYKLYGKHDTYVKFDVTDGIFKVYAQNGVTRSDDPLWIEDLKIFHNDLSGLGRIEIPILPNNTSDYAIEIPEIKLQPHDINFLKKYNSSNYFNYYNQNYAQRPHGAGMYQIIGGSNTLTQVRSLDTGSPDEVRDIKIILSDRTYYNFHADYGCSINGYIHGFRVIKTPDNWKLKRYRCRWFRNSNRRYYSSWIDVLDDYEYGTILYANTGTSQWSDSGSAVDMIFEHSGIEFTVTLSEHKGRTTRAYGAMHPFKCYLKLDDDYNNPDKKLLYIMWWVPGATPVNR